MLLAGAVSGVVIALAVTGVLILTGGDGEDTGDTPNVSSAVSKSTAGSADDRRPQLGGPASRFIPTLQEMQPGSKTYPPNTYTMTPLAWGSNGLFASPSEGEAKAEQLGYIDGYQVEYQPPGQLAGVLQGSWYTTVEIALFADATKAATAYALYEERYRTTGGSQLAPAKRLGNQSSGWSVIGKETVGPSDTLAIYHRFVFQRGNMVAMVQTMGGQPFMNIDPARDTAVLIDERATGGIPAFTPTPEQQATTPAKP